MNLFQKIIFFCAAAMAAVPATCQVADSTHQSVTISEVQVEAFNTHRSLLQTAGAISRIDSQELQRNNNISLQTGLNLVPGVRMESRGIGGSPLLSIRGSKLRDPFAVRNIKIYWNGIPITSPDGTTPSEVLDPQFTSSAEIIKGPGSSLYGAGTGGVMLFNTHFAAANTQISITGGSYGLVRTSYMQTIASRNNTLTAGFVHQQNDGYRAQEANRKDLGFFNLSFYLRPSTTLTLSGYFYDGMWQLPGGLTLRQADSAPRQANAYSMKVNASLSRTTGRFGVTLDEKINAHSNVNIVLFSSTTRKENPYGTSRYFNGYKSEPSSLIGLRSQYDYHIRFLRFTAGIEAQDEFDYLRESENLTGIPGDLKADYTTQAIQAMAFAQAEVALPLHFILTAGASYNSLRYIHTDNDDMDTTDHSGKLTFHPDITPRIALIKTFSNKCSLYGSISSGFSQPDVLEVIGPYGTINSALKSETGINYEVGTKAMLLNNRLFIDVSAYSFQLNNAILPANDTIGYTIYQNAGKTDQQGIEAVISYNAVGKGHFITTLRPWVSGTITAYHFKDYEVDGVNYKNKLLPGIPDKVVTTGIDVSVKDRVFIYATYQYNGRIGLNNANTDFQQAYQLLDIKAAYHLQVKKLNFELFAGANYLLNASYTSFFQLNDAAKRYYNPEPPATFYAGVALRRPGTAKK